MSIQFSKNGKCTVSIKNRYNHTVNNPDATFGNDLNRIIPGLEQSFEELLKQRGLKLNKENKEKLAIPNYVVASDGKYYKYNMEVNGIYYCPGNIIIDNGEVIQLPKNQTLIDYFILDETDKTIKLYDKSLSDSFIEAFEKIKNIKITKNMSKKNGGRVITIEKENQETPIIIEINKENQISAYQNNELVKVGDHFLFSNKGIKKLNLPNLEEAENYFLQHNENLTELCLPNLYKVGCCFLNHNQKITDLYLPNLSEAETEFLYNNQELNILNLPNLRLIHNGFIALNRKIKQVNLPKLEEIEGSFLRQNTELTNLSLPNLTKTDNRFLQFNKRLTKLYLPKLIETGDTFLMSNEALIQLCLPEIIKTGKYFLYINNKLQNLEMPKLRTVDDDFLYNNNSIETIYLPNLLITGKNFLRSNNVLKELILPKLTRSEKNFLATNKSLIRLSTPKASYLYNRFNSIMCKNRKLLAKTKKIVDATDIARLDKMTELTESDIETAKANMEQLSSQFKDINEK